MDEIGNIVISGRLRSLTSHDTQGNVMQIETAISAYQLLRAMKKVL